ncbi:MAG TPA: isoprenyl transferase [Erysipelothrix sp.]|nr:isoprenyl transferase [Erysipelothrix sp.]
MNNQLNHIAIIMDGNGRWAKKQDQKRTFGHFHGAENVRNVAIAAQELGIKVLTLFAFSTENWKRPLEEIDYLMKLPAYFFDKFMKELMERQIKIEFIGHFSRLPQGTQKVLKRAMEQSKNNTAMKLVFAMDYGGRDELVEGFKRYAQDVVDGRENNITEDEVENYLMTTGLGDVDLLIRTSMEYRISNFLLWQIAYAELLFVEKPWPKFTPEDLKLCIDEYHQRQRRFGGLG